MSAISQVSISRPVLAGVMSVLLILFGIVGYTFLGTREYPVTDSPIVTVVTVYPGAVARFAIAKDFRFRDLEIGPILPSSAFSGRHSSKEDEMSDQAADQATGFGSLVIEVRAKKARHGYFWINRVPDRNPDGSPGSSINEPHYFAQASEQEKDRFAAMFPRLQAGEWKVSGKREAHSNGWMVLPRITIFPNHEATIVIANDRDMPL